MFDEDTIEQEVRKAAIAVGADLSWDRIEYGSVISPVESAADLLSSRHRFVEWVQWERAVARALVGVIDVGAMTEGFGRLLHDTAVIPVSWEAQVAPVGQLSLALRGTFAPSRPLTEFWVRGVTAFAQRAQATPIEYTTGSLQEEFANSLTSLLGSMGQRVRYGATRNHNFTEGGRFLLEYQVQLCDRFLVIPDEAAAFLQMLREELFSAVSNGCRIEGAWGRVTATADGDLRFALTPPNIVRDPDFVRSEEVE